MAFHGIYAYIRIHIFCHFSYILPNILSDIYSDSISINYILPFFLAFSLASILAFYLTSILTFYLAFSLTFSSVRHLFWHSIWHLFWHSIWHSLWHSLQSGKGTREKSKEGEEFRALVQTLSYNSTTPIARLTALFYQGKLWRDDSDPEVAVRVRRGTLRSSACSWGPAGNTLILSLLFGARRGTLRSSTCS